MTIGGLLLAVAPKNGRTICEMLWQEAVMPATVTPKRWPPLPDTTGPAPITNRFITGRASSSRITTFAFSLPPSYSGPRDAGNWTRRECVKESYYSIVPILEAEEERERVREGWGEFIARSWRDLLHVSHDVLAGNPLSKRLLSVLWNTVQRSTLVNRRRQR